MAIHDEDTAVDLEMAATFADRFFATATPPLKFQIAAATHVGKVRTRNEDHHAVIRSRRTREVLFTNLPKEGHVLPDDEVYGMVVADGIGGAASGDVASRLALRTMLELTGRATSSVVRITDLDTQQIHERVEAYISEIQKTLRSYSARNRGLAGMGTTWTSAHVFGTDAIIVHIGDSRAYVYSGSDLQMITRDQTLGQEMAEVGMPEAAVKRFRHILTNSLGGDAEVVEAAVYQAEIQPDDRLLLCSDGLSDMVTDPQIADVLESEPTAQTACDQLVERALDAGGKDNITVVVCDVVASE
jgi:serine/threonine protein phosphatase PrpC